MAVEKLELVSMIGPLAELDRIAEKYILGHDVHLENIFSVLDNPKGLYPFAAENPYTDIMRQMTEILSQVNIDKSTIDEKRGNMELDEIKSFAENFSAGFISLNEEKENLIKQKQDNDVVMLQLEHIKNFDFHLSKLFDLKFVKVRFGQIPRESYDHLDRYLDDYNTFFFKYDEDRDYIYGMYLAPEVIHEKVDTIFSSLYFKRSKISESADGTPAEVLERLESENKEAEEKLNGIQTKLSVLIEKNTEKIKDAYSVTKRLYDGYGVRKYAAHTNDSFYLSGWMIQRDIQKLKDDFVNEKNITILTEKAELINHLTPPTKLRNFALFRPFEGFVKMYGLPSYGEVDPTMIFALTYSFMFGAMYGDMGHGLVLALIGFLMARKKNFLGPILEICGVVSIVFGALYGSAFGEGKFEPLWYSPMEKMMSTLIMAVAFGAVIITVAMIINIINGIRNKDIGKMLFSPNGVAGFIFYWAIIIGVLSMVMGNSVLKSWYIILFVVIPLILVFFKEPLTKLLKRRKDWMPKKKGEFFLETFFEMFEVLLSYITNTISFIRVGAFALNHAGMMAVVSTLSGMVKGSSSIVVIIIGNIIVLGLEGLLVAIQVLRLQFYEMFSRYYDGTGKPFENYGDNN